MCVFVQYRAGYVRMFVLSSAADDGVQTLAIAPGRLFQIPESQEMAYICQRTMVLRV